MLLILQSEIIITNRKQCCGRVPDSWQGKSCISQCNKWSEPSQRTNKNFPGFLLICFLYEQKHLAQTMSSFPTHQNENPFWEQIWTKYSPNAVNILDEWSKGQDRRTVKTAANPLETLTGTFTREAKAMKNTTVKRSAERLTRKTLLPGPEF